MKKILYILALLPLLATAQPPTATWLYVEGLKAARLNDDPVVAQQWFEQALEADPDHVATLAAAAVNIAPMDAQRALDYGRRAYELDSSDEWLRNLLTRLLLLNSRYEEAATLNPGDFDLAQFYAHSLLARGDVERSVQVYKDFIRDTTSVVEPYIMVLEGEAYLERADSVKVWARRTIEQFPDSVVRSEVYTFMGDMLSQQDKVRQSAEQYRTAILLNPNNARALNNLAYNLAERGRELELALQMIERAIKISPDVPTYIDTYGWVLFRLGRLEDAKKALRQAVSMADDPEIMLHYAEVLEALGEDFMAQHYREQAQGK